MIALYKSFSKISLKPQFLIRCNFFFFNQSTKSRDIFGYHNWEGAIGNWWLEARDTANIL